MDTGVLITLTSLVTSGLTGGAAWFFKDNNKFREGLSNAILSKVNKANINKIPLDKHSLFGLLERKKADTATFVIDDPVKMAFYMTYIRTTFKGIRQTAEEIIRLEAEGVSIESSAMKEIYKMHANIDTSISETLNIPKKVEHSFTQWRDMMTSSCNMSMTEILHDDLMANNYISAYRVLDVLMFYVHTLLNSGAVEMTRLNGSFKGLELTDIINTNNAHSTISK